MIRHIIRIINDMWIRRSSESLINYYRAQGIKIGE